MPVDAEVWLDASVEEKPRTSSITEDATEAASSSAPHLPPVGTELRR